MKEVPPGRRAAANSSGNGEKECKIVSLFSFNSSSSSSSSFWVIGKSSFATKHLWRSTGLVVVVVAKKRGERVVGR